MKCPFCAHLGDKVVDSRESKEGEVIRRRRECLECGKRFTSYERIDEIPYMVVKKDGRRERFERPRPVSPARIPSAVRGLHPMRGVAVASRRAMSTQPAGTYR